MLRGRPDLARLATGISAFGTAELARKKALQCPVLGTFIAELVLSDESGVQAERTTTSRGHYTLWARPERLLELVREVWPVTLASA